MPGKKGGTAKPNEQLKKKTKEYDDVNLFLLGGLRNVEEKKRRRGKIEIT